MALVFVNTGNYVGIQTERLARKVASTSGYAGDTDAECMGTISFSNEVSSGPAVRIKSHCVCFRSCLLNL